MMLISNRIITVLGNQCFSSTCTCETGAKEKSKEPVATLKVCFRPGGYGDEVTVRSSSFADFFYGSYHSGRRILILSPPLS